MPKVRDSSGTMGTTYLPTFLSRTRVPSICTKAIVVEISRSSVLFNSRSNVDSGGICSAVDWRWLALMLDRGGVSRVDLHRIVAAAVQVPDLVVGHVGDQCFQFRILAEELLPYVGTVLAFEVLVFAVDALLHPLEQQAAVVLGKQLVPAAAPHHFDDIPSGAPEHRFQFLDDLAVAAHGAVEPLQIAVDDEYQIIEMLAAGK